MDALTMATAEKALDSRIVKLELGLLVELMDLLGDEGQRRSKLEFVHTCFARRGCYGRDQRETTIVFQVESGNDPHGISSDPIVEKLVRVKEQLREVLGDVELLDEPNDSGIPRFIFKWKPGVVVMVGH